VKSEPSQRQGPPARRAFVFEVGVRSGTVPIVLTVAALASFAASWFGLFMGGREVVRFTGLELVFGTRFSSASPAAFLGAVQPQLGAQIAAAAGVVALLLSFFRNRAMAVGGAVASTLAAAGLLATAGAFPATIHERVTSVIEIKRGVGYYLDVLLFVAAAIGWALSMVRQPRDSATG
jgi:hypothetical protein